MISLLTALSRPWRRQVGGQVALETLIVFGPWLVVTSMFFNLLYVMGSVMLVNSELSNITLQAAANGCLPQDVRNTVADRIMGGAATSNGPRSLGVRDVEIIPYTNQNAPGETPSGGPSGSGWPTSDEIAQASTNWKTAYCATPAPTLNKPNLTDRHGAIIPVESGNFILLRIKYRQKVAWFSDIQMSATSLALSQNINGEHN